MCNLSQGVKEKSKMTSKSIDDINAILEVE